MHTLRTRGLLAAWLAASILSGCSGSGTSSVSCAGTLEEALIDLGIAGVAEIDTPLGGELVADTTIPGVDGLVFDPHPLGRGAHPVHRYWRDPATCEVKGGLYAWGPPAHSPAGAATPTWTTLGGPTASARVRIIAIHGPDPGAAEDHQAWLQALVAVGGRGASLFLPDRALVEDTIESTCADVGPVDTALLVTTGRASPAGGGALLLDGEAITYGRLAEIFAGHCGEAGLRVWVVDAAYAQGLDGEVGALAPVVLWRASNQAHPDAPRIAKKRGGLLSAALAGHVETRAASICLADRDGAPGELQWVFDGAWDVSARMLALRWENIGAPWMALRGQDLASMPRTQHTLAAAVSADVPGKIRVESGVGAPGLGCNVDGDCWMALSQCERGICETWTCQEGRCLPAPREGAECDDSSICTVNDECDGAGLCRGTWIQCYDGDPCTVDTCLFETGCSYSILALGDPCDDLDACTEGDSCDGSGQCVGGVLDCDDGDPCTNDVCDAESGCEYSHASAPCDDANVCTHQDYCHGGICSGQPLPCTDGNACTVNACDPEDGCVFPFAPDGLPCDDTDPCTLDDRCHGGLCEGQDRDCDDGLGCTLDFCEQGTCQHLPPPATCTAPDGCVEVGQSPAGDPCSVCVATDVLEADPEADGVSCADDGNACTVDVCLGGACVHPMIPDTCQTPDGACVSVGEPLTQCLLCVGTGVGAPAAEGSACDDGDPCTEGDACGPGGDCGGTPIPCCHHVSELQCGDGIEGEITPADVSSLVTFWPCYSSNIPMVSPERIHPFEAPCTGSFLFDYDGQAGSLLFLVQGDEEQDVMSACASGACQGYTPFSLQPQLEQGEMIYVLVDAVGGVSGTYTIDVSCNCDP